MVTIEHADMTQKSEFEISIQNAMRDKYACHAG